MDPVVISCRCPGNHPDGDSIVLREKLSFEAGMVLVVLAGQDTDDLTEIAEKGARVATTMVCHGVESWNVVDEAGKPVRVSPSAVKAWLGEQFDAAVVPLINAAFGQYQGTVMRPLAPATSGSPANGRTGRSMSRSSRSSPKPRS